MAYGRGERGAGNQGGRGGSRGGGRGGRGGRGGGRGAARGGRGLPPPGPVPEKKQAPRFVKIDKLQPGKAAFLLVKVADVDTEATIQQSRGANARTFSVKCTQALVGDETGCILLTTQQEDVSQVLKANEGKVVGILNVKMRSVGGTARLEVDAFSTVKPLADLQAQPDVVPADFAESFEINRNQDRTKKRPKKPTFAKVSTLEPEKKNLNLLVKVASVKITDRPRADGTVSKVAEAVVGDEEASINLLVRNEKAISLLEQDKVVAIFNAHIEMQKSQDKTNQSFMRLVVDRWGDVKNTGDLPAEILAADATLPQTVNTNDNKSQVEWLLQDE